MKFPLIPESVRLERLTPLDGKIRIIIDSDTYNEIDDQFTWSFDKKRHFIRSAYFVKRDLIFRDLFKKLETYAKSSV